MNFNFQRHMRLAGVVVTVVGFFMNSFPVMIVGNVIVAIGYMASVAKIELYIEAQEPKSKEEAEDALR